MWLFTETGFVSAVVNSENRGKIVARARDKESLDALSKLVGRPVATTPRRDYQFRVVVERETFHNWISNSVERLDYTNFKNRMWETRGANFSEPLHDVWAVMRRVTDPEEPG
jgi:hypothetical protein